MTVRRLLISVALALTAGAVAWAFSGLPGTPAACLPVDCDCEPVAPGPIRQPANAWSALALTATGVFLASASPGRRPGEARPKAAEGANHNPTFAGGDAPAGRRTRFGFPRGGGGKHQPTPPGEARGRAVIDGIAAAALVAAGLGAFLYHAGLTAWAARLDGITVAVVAAALGLRAAGRLLRPPGGEGPPGRDLRRRLAPWPLLALGAACWWLGRSGGPWCRPDLPLPAHAAWHLLAAAAIGLWLAPARGGPQPPAPSSLRAERPSSP